MQNDIHGRGLAVLGFVGFVLACTNASAEQPLIASITQGKLLVDIRTRYEAVDDDNCTACAGQDADALTVRARLGYETGYWNDLSLLFEFDQIWSLGSEDYNSTRNGETTFPVVADPEMTQLNRLQLSYATDFDTKIVFGRQRLLFGNQRFVGNVGWRQHEQTFDALTFVNTSLPDLTVTYSYVNRVNRVFGPDAPIPASGQADHFDSNSHLADAIYVGIPNVKLEAYGLLLDLEQDGPSPATALKLSTATFGLRAEGKWNVEEGWTLQAAGEYAHQSDYAANPLSVDLAYWLAEAGVGYEGFTLLAGREVMEGDGAIGFSTPLATMHAFDGWADMFLTTPVNGLTNSYVKASYTANEALGLKSMTANVIYRDFATERTDIDIGTELDASLEFVIDKNASVLLKHASYDGDGVGFGGFKDKTISWISLNYKL